MSSTTHGALGARVQIGRASWTASAALEDARDTGSSDAAAFALGDLSDRPSLLVPPSEPSPFNTSPSEGMSVLNWWFLHSPSTALLTTSRIAHFVEASGYETWAPWILPSSSVVQVARPVVVGSVQYVVLPSVSLLLGSPIELCGAIPISLEGSAAFQDYEPFDEAAERFEKALAALRAGTGVSHGSRIAERIRTLARAAEEEGELGPSAEAAEGLLAFLQTSLPLKYPDLTLGPRGALLAEWRGSEGRLLGVYLADSLRAKFVVFRPNPRHPELMDRYSGTTTVDEVVSKVVDLEGISWAREQ